MTDTSKAQRIAALNSAIDRAGGIVAFSKAMGVTHQAIYSWKRRGWTPADKALVIESIFGVPRTDLMEPRLAAVLTTPLSQTAEIL